MSNLKQKKKLLSNLILNRSSIVYCSKSIDESTYDLNDDLNIFYDGFKGLKEGIIYQFPSSTIINMDDPLFSMFLKKISQYLDDYIIVQKRLKENPTL